MEESGLESTVIEYLILEGAAEVSAMSEDGEPLFRFTSKLKEVNPELYANIQNYFNTNVMTLWQKGFLILDPTDQNTMVSLTDLVYDKNAVSNLDKHEKTALDSIIASFNKLK